MRWSSKGGKCIDKFAQISLSLVWKDTKTIDEHRELTAQDRQDEYQQNEYRIRLQVDPRDEVHLHDFSSNELNIR